jgi:hypothetical protein
MKECMAVYMFNYRAAAPRDLNRAISAGTKKRAIPPPTFMPNPGKFPCFNL